MASKSEPLIQDLGDGGEVEALLKYVISSSDIEMYQGRYEKEVETNSLESDTKFRYAWCLVHSKQANVRKAIPLLEELFKDGDEQTKRDSLFYLALAHTKLREYCIAKQHVVSFLSVEPENMQAKQLEAYIQTHLKSDGLTGMAIIGGAAVVGGLAAVVIGGVVLATGAGVAAVKAARNFKLKR